jgi:hypothetical protein
LGRGGDSAAPSRDPKMSGFSPRGAMGESCARSRGSVAQPKEGTMAAQLKLRPSESHGGSDALPKRFHE